MGVDLLFRLLLLKLRQYICARLSGGKKCCRLYVGLFVALTSAMLI